MIEEPAVSAFSRIWSWQRGYRHARRRGGLIFSGGLMRGFRLVFARADGLARLAFM